LQQTRKWVLTTLVYLDEINQFHRLDFFKWKLFSYTIQKFEGNVVWKWFISHVSCSTRELPWALRPKSSAAQFSFPHFPGVTPPHPDKHQISLIDSAHDRGLVAFNAYPLNVPQKGLVLETGHYLSRVQLEVANLGNHMITTVMLWP